MRMPFAVWSGLIAVLVYAGAVALAYRNYGYLDFQPAFGIKLAAVWLGLVVLVAIAGAVRKAFTARPAEIPSDVARELDSHPE
jgi:hypothetical protein